MILIGQYDSLRALEADRATRGTPCWLGQSLTHADIAFACALRFVRETHPGLVDATGLPSLSDQAAPCEELREFREVVLPIANKL